MERAFTPFTLGPVTLRNRFIKAATFEGMSADGMPSDALREFHRRTAAGGAAMTTVAYASVSADGRSYDTQLLMTPAVVTGLRALTDAVHREGAAAALQLGHCGNFADPRVTGTRNVGPSRMFNLYQLAGCREASRDDMVRITGDFVGATRLAAEAGFDAVEIHLGHGYLLSQFLSPFTNKRRDIYGGAMEGRLRFPLEVVTAVRETAGERMAVLVKMNLTDGFPGGLMLNDALEAGRRLEEVGVDALVMSGGFVSRTPLFMLRGGVPVQEMAAAQQRWLPRVGMRLFGRFFVQEYPWRPAFFLNDAIRMRAAVGLPLVLLGGIGSVESIVTAMDRGFELVGMARALIHDPDLVGRMQRGEAVVSGCVPCNECIAEMDRGGVRCTRPGNRD